MKINYIFLFFYSLVMLTFSFILQFHFHLLPCSLCVFCRVIVILILILFGVAWIHNPKTERIQKRYVGIGGILAIIGILVSARHLWIMHLPPEKVPACSPGFNYLLETLSFPEALFTILKSAGECAENNTAFLGISLPAWTLIGFLMLGIGCAYAYLFPPSGRVK